MASRAERRTDALSKERIVETAIEILDADGESALTFRALTERLSTGAGALYWHVANKNELLAATINEVIARAMTEVIGTAESQASADMIGPAEPRASADVIGAAESQAGAGVIGAMESRVAVRAIALAVFDAFDAHPWAGSQLSREPWQPAALQIFEAIGGQLDGLGVPPESQFDAATALVTYILGLAGQYSAAARLLSPGTDRSAFLAGIAAEWEQSDATQYPFVRRMAAQLRDHDDRDQFLAGIDLLLTGMTSGSPPRASS